MMGMWDLLGILDQRETQDLREIGVFQGYRECVVLLEIPDLTDQPVQQVQLDPWNCKINTYIAVRSLRQRIFILLEYNTIK
jgi:hypothetical protein